MFTEADRRAMRERMIAIARDDARVTGGALVGSSGTGTEDAWSDTDITFGIRDDAGTATVLEKWTRALDSEYGIVDHFDVRRGAAIYRVLLFESCVEMDLSVVPASTFGPLAPGFSLLFGAAVDRTESPAPDARETIGWGWHHLLHANSAMRRGRLWQAELWISALRDHVFALASIRHGLPAAFGRSIHLLPAEETAPLTALLVRTIDAAELRRALDAALPLFIAEVARHDAALAERLERTLRIAIAG